MGTGREVGANPKCSTHLGVSVLVGAEPKETGDSRVLLQPVPPSHSDQRETEKMPA